MLEQMALAAKQASYQLAQCSTQEKNQALQFIADELIKQQALILQANQQDISAAKTANLTEAMIDRLLLTPERIAMIANDVRQVCCLSDPVGEIIDGKKLNSGLSVQRKRVPLGVIGVIYESRPNVTIDVAALCLKTGNAVILRGGKETEHTNRVLVTILQQTLLQSALPEFAIQSIDDLDRKWITQLVKLDKYIDMIIPRGGYALQQFCQQHATVPVIMGGIGVCHIFVDKTADFDKALNIIKNAKTQRPSTCNTVETLLVHQDICETFLPRLSQSMADVGVTLHTTKKTISLLQSFAANVMLVDDDALQKEWLSLDLNVITVNDIDCAIQHIRKYGSGHSEVILTESLISADIFINCVDAAVVYVNSSTRFTDGAQFGLGAEIAVSTQKLHARGPMGLEALTTYKWIAISDGLIRH